MLENQATTEESGSAPDYDGRGTIADVQLMITLLSWDIAYLEQFCGSPVPPQIHRSIVRAVFAYIEAVTFALKRFALEYHRTERPRFTDAELVFLIEEKKEGDGDLTYGIPRMKESGDVTVTEVKVGFFENIKFAIKSVAKLEEVGVGLNLNDPRKNDFFTALRVRDRLMHPKSCWHLAVTDAELASIKTGCEWFTETVNAVLKAHAEAYAERRKSEGDGVNDATSPDGLKSVCPF